MRDRVWLAASATPAIISRPRCKVAPVFGARRPLPGPTELEHRERTASLLIAGLLQQRVAAVHGAVSRETQALRSAPHNITPMVKPAGPLRT